MSSGRTAQAGVTLVEMLVAIAVSSMIGISGFILLEGLNRTEAGISGRLDMLRQQDRAFQLLTLDLRAAHAAQLDGVLALEMAHETVTWAATDTGVTRRISRASGDMEQRILTSPARFMRQSARGLELRLVDQDISRRFAWPSGPAK